MPYAEQRDVLFRDRFGWFDAYIRALASYGYDVEIICGNVEPLQRTWAKEQGFEDYHNMPLANIAAAQVGKYCPDIVWFDSSDSDALKAIQQEQSQHFLIGWAGSAFPKKFPWNNFNLVLSCAPESVSQFREADIDSEHLNHAFDPVILSEIDTQRGQLGFSFIGQLVRGLQFHQNREEMLLKLVEEIDISVYSPSANNSIKADIKYLVKYAFYQGGRFLGKVGVPASKLQKFLKVASIQPDAAPVRPVHPLLKKYLKPAVYGLDMYQAIAQSRVMLNIHADSSPLYASNARLFEVTGVGTCLLTDYKENISELFEVDKEVLTYSSISECVEKAHWLLDNPDECEKIAAAGQQRVLRDHTFDNRAIQLDQLIRERI